MLPAVPVTPTAVKTALALPAGGGGGRERVLRALYLGRLSLATAIFIAAVVVWRAADSTATLLATLAFVSTLLFTGASMFYSEQRNREPGDTFFYIQVMFDLLLVTAVVHLTQAGTPSQLAPLYILVIAVSALVLPPAGVLLIAALGDVLYFAVTIVDQATVWDLPVLVQLGIFGAVALGCGYIGARLRHANAGREEMAAELAAFRLREADIERLHTRAERLEAVAEMSASLAHEIKNPLASIRSAAELLAKVPGADDDTRTLTKLVQRESDRLSRLLSEFLDFARTGVTSVRRLDLLDIAHHAAALVAAHPDKPENVTIKELFPSSSLVVVGDDDLLHRAIFNLLLNAVQASPPGGEVRLEATELSPHQLPAQAEHFVRGGIMLQVTDQGNGIADSVKDRMFEPFVTTKTGGSGLGLSIVHRAVEAHHGFILVDAAGPAGGTKITVILPKLGGDATRKTPKATARSEA
ncbi:MAG TPA: HAMP domain-containing sensor histidine kinase [Gemmatimonadaceae bacterium]|nr:HAMP domain-containing sensor histidine kinase [Gemmatimonadaceae bacterium]